MPAASPARRVILLVDDQENDITLITKAFGRADPDTLVVSAPGGLEAMAYLSGDPPYQDRSRYPFPLLVLLDIRMPGVDGFEVLRWVRHNPELAKLPMVMLTGSDEIGQAELAYRLGANSFLVKPFDFADVADLARVVNRIIARGGP